MCSRPICETPTSSSAPAASGGCPAVQLFSAAVVVLEAAGPRCIVAGLQPPQSGDCAGGLREARTRAGRTDRCPGLSVDASKCSAQSTIATSNYCAEQLILRQILNPPGPSAPPDTNARRPAIGVGLAISPKPGILRICAHKRHETGAAEEALAAGCSPAVPTDESWRSPHRQLHRVRRQGQTRLSLTAGDIVCRRTVRLATT